MAGLLKNLPALAAAFREGRLSEIQAREIAEVASEVPGAEGQFVEAAGKLSLKELRDKCQRVEALAPSSSQARRRQRSVPSSP